MLLNFNALDFEKANYEHDSVCSVGVVYIRDGRIAGKYYELVRPEPNRYEYYASKIHGITPEHTKNARLFPEVWADVMKKAGDYPFVAHNAQVEIHCLQAEGRKYHIDTDVPVYCTLKASKKNNLYLPSYGLETVAAHFGYDLKSHHNALADAEACAIIAKNIMNEEELKPTNLFQMKK